MYIKKRRMHPRIFTDVLQAILDLRDIRGSTIKTIIDQVQTSINESQLPKPKNMVMQVQKALRHGINSGVIKERAGKYKLTFGNDLPNVQSDVDDKDRQNSPAQDKPCKIKKRKPKCDNKCIPPKPRRCRPPNRRQKIRKPRKPCRRQATSCSSETSGVHSEKKARSVSQSPEKPESQVKINGRTRRNICKSSKFKKIDRPRSKSKRPNRKIKIERKLHKPTNDPQKRGSPEPVDPDTSRYNGEVNQNDKGKELKKEPEKREDEHDQEQEDLVHYMNYQNDDSDSKIPQCDNPECLCHLKHEPDDD